MSEILTPLNVGVDRETGFPAPCWCGEKKGWCSTLYLQSNCAGTGMLDCFCGGDFCVCHNHGEVECYGCPDCDEPDVGDLNDDDMFGEL